MGTPTPYMYSSYMSTASAMPASAPCPGQQIGWTKRCNDRQNEGQTPRQQE